MHQIEQSLKTTEVVNVNTELSNNKPSLEPSLIVQKQQPGRLEVEADFPLYTRTAQRCFNEGWSKTMSVIKFAHRMLKIWQAAAHDDPYADLFLLRVHATIIHARRELEKLKEKYLKAFQAEEDLNLRLSNTDKPIILSLRFGTPYGYMVAYMLKDYDRLARCVLSAHYLGLVLDEPPLKILRKARDLMRKVFAKARGWRKTQVTREDVRQKTARAEKAFKLMGKLNEQVLAGQLRAYHAPAIRIAIAKHAAVKE